MVYVLLLYIPLFKRGLFKNYLNKKHVKQCPSSNGEKRIFLPAVYQNDGNAGDQLWQSERCLQQGNILEAVNHQHTDDSVRKYFSEVHDVSRCLGFSRKQLEEKMDYDMEISEILKLVRVYEKKAERKIPVAVGGGICDKARAEHGFMLGADLIQVASRFITTKECDADSAYKDAYLKARKEDIVLVSSPVGMPGRAIRNPFLERVEKGEFQRPQKCFGCLKHCNPAEIPYCITEALIHAVKGDTENGLLFCGAQVYLANQIETVQDVMEDLLGGL